MEKCRSTIMVVSLGPGDPEMITLKGLAALKRADIIFTPVTQREGRELSRSRDMLLALGIDSGKIEPYLLPMSLDRSKALEVYRSVAERCKELSSEGQEVVITAEGDGGFFSSSQYIHEMLTGDGFSVERIAGVPAFIDCAALAGMHVASGDRALTVIPRLESVKQIVDLISVDAALRSNVVLMKLSGSEEVIKEALKVIGDSATFHYIENRGGESEFYSSQVDVILNRKFPYFSILIVEAK